MVRGFTAPAASSSSSASNHVSQRNHQHQQHHHHHQQQHKSMPPTSSSISAAAAAASNKSLNHPDQSEKSHAFSVISANALVGVGGSILSGDSVNGDEEIHDRVNDGEMLGNLKNLSLKSGAALEGYDNIATALHVNEQGQAQGHAQGHGLGQSIHVSHAGFATTNEMRQPIHPVVHQVEIPFTYHENDSNNNTHQHHINQRNNMHSNHRPVITIPLSHTVSSSGHLHPNPHINDKVSPLVPQTFTLLRKATSTKLLDKRGKYRLTHTLSTHHLLHKCIHTVQIHAFTFLIHLF